MEGSSVKIEREVFEKKSPRKGKNNPWSWWRSESFHFPLDSFSFFVDPPIYNFTVERKKFFFFYLRFFHHRILLPFTSNQYVEVSQLKTSSPAAAASRVTTLAAAAVRTTTGGRVFLNLWLAAQAYKLLIELGDFDVTRPTSAWTMNECSSSYLSFLISLPSIVLLRFRSPSHINNSFGFWLGIGE